MRNSRNFPLLIGSYLKSAIEVDVDAVSDGKDVYIAGVIEHIEEAGIHSGDSACVIPPHSLNNSVIKEIEKQTTRIAKALKVKGLLNVQLAIQNNDIFVISLFCS